MTGSSTTQDWPWRLLLSSLMSLRTGSTYRGSPEVPDDAGHDGGAAGDHGDVGGRGRVDEGAQGGRGRLGLALGLGVAVVALPGRALLGVLQEVRKVLLERGNHWKE